MSHDDTSRPLCPRTFRQTTDEDALLLLARECEWAEAYAADHPDCAMGRIYLNFLRRELVIAQAHL